MTTLVIRHAVSDFAAWKRAFDADPLGRARNGVLHHRVYRDGADVVIHLEFATRAEAEAFLSALRGLWRSAGGPLGLGEVAVQLLDEAFRD